MRGLVYSKFSVGIVILLVFWFSVSVFERFTVERQMSQKKELKEKELNILQERATLLESKVKHLEDERGIEEELRDRFDVAREGEQVVIIIDDEDDTDLSELSGPPREKEDDLEKSILEVFKFW